MERIKVKPIGNLVIVKPKEAINKTDGGIFLPEQAIEKPNEGTIVAVGDGIYAMQTGLLIPMQTKVGDIVAYPANIGADITVNNISYKIMKETDLFAKL